MAFLYGRKFTKAELLKRVGDISQIAQARLCELADGSEKGVRAIDVRTGSGFAFMVLPDRGLDISFAEYCGQPLCWRSSTGDVGPSFFEPEGLGWLRTFYGGLLLTCGLSYAGAPCTDEGKDLGLHGRISHVPARNVSVDGQWRRDDYILAIQGKVRETSVFGDDLQLTRKITAKLGEKRLFLHDRVENLGYQASPHMIVYHINLGFPVVDNGAELISPTKTATPRDDAAQVGAEEYHKFQAPTPGFAERVYYHEMAADKEGHVAVAVVNRKFNGGQGFGCYVRYRKDQLPRLVEWKMNGEGTYAVGVEPSNCGVGGRDKEHAAGTLRILQPGECQEYELEIGALASQAEIAEIEEFVKARRAGRSGRR